MSQDWELLGFQNKNCQSFLIVSENEIIVSLVNRQDPAQTGLYKTTNGGVQWVDFTNGFGGDDIEPVFEIIVNPTNPSVYYSIGHFVVARSDDKGESWQPIYGEWQSFATGMSFIRVNPNYPDAIWVGGKMDLSKVIYFIQEMVGMIGPNGLIL